MISGKLLTLLLTWLLLSPAFRLRKFSQGSKQGLASPGGLSLTLSYFFGLMRNVTLSVALGYYSVYLCVVPQLLTALILGICKYVADKEFRKWSFSNQVMYVLLGSLVPCATPKSDREDRLEKDEIENQGEPEGTFITKNEEKAQREEFEVKNESASALEEEGQVTEEQSEESNEMILSQRSRAKELCAIFIIHAVSVLIGVLTFAILHETSTELVTTETKVKDASKVDLMLSVYIGCPAALLASVLFRVIHAKLGPWRAINPLPSTCSAICPPGFTSEEKLSKISLLGIEENEGDVEDSKQE